MKYIFLNLKRFDIIPEFGGVNSIATPSRWGVHIAESLSSQLSQHPEFLDHYLFPIFLPEAHLIPAAEVLSTCKNAVRPLLGCQSIHHADTVPGGNFGAFTTLRTANSVKQLGCTWTIIGHSEERRTKSEYMSLAGASPEQIRKAVNTLLAQETACALKAGLNVLFCIGETIDEVPRRAEVLKNQLAALNEADTSRIVLAYEPIWAIGPGKTPPTAEQIAETVQTVKQLSSCPLVYGGGLKKENAESIGAIPGLDGGLIALTRFSGTIGFYPDEYMEIVEAYIKGEHNT